MSFEVVNLQTKQRLAFVENETEAIDLLQKCIGYFTPRVCGENERYVYFDKLFDTKDYGWRITFRGDLG